jgi:thiamine kinase-like enzyme
MKTENEIVHLKNVLAIESVMLGGEEVSSLPKPSVLSVSYFKSGGGNHLYLINADGRHYLARVNFYPLKNVWRIKEHEFACLKMLEPLGIAPRAYFIDCKGQFLEQHFIIVDFLEGDTLGNLEKANILALADTLKKLHSSFTFDRPGNTLPPSDDLPYACEIFHEFANGEDKQIEKYADLPGIEKIVEPFRRIKARLGVWFRERDCFDGCTKFSLCHADLKRENILQSKEKILLIDWECAGSDIPETDIGRLFSGCQFTQEQEELFLARYYPGEPGSVMRDRIATVRTVLDFFRIIEDYILLKRRPWNAEDMRRDLENFERRYLLHT